MMVSRAGEDDRMNSWEVSGQLGSKWSCKCSNIYKSLRSLYAIYNVFLN